MRVAAQTVIWGNRLDNLANVLDLLATHGCEGVEFSQRPEMLGNIATLLELLGERRLTFLGLSGGTLLDRMRFCGEVGRPEYLYVEGWDREAPAAVAEGFTLALHPHLFKPLHRLDDAKGLLNEHPELKFLPDAAHLHIAGDSLARAIAELHPRLAAVHVKDWTPEYGRSSHRYARGFTELGRGVINFTPIFNQLRQIAYKGWIVFEQGTSDSTPERTVQHATAWLARKTARMLPRRTALRSSAVPQPVTASPLCPPWTDRAEKEFLEAILSVANEDVRRLVIICTCSPDADVRTILSVAPTDTPLDSYFTRYAHSLSSVALDRQEVTEFDLTAPSPGRLYGHRDARLDHPYLVQAAGLKRMTSVPVLDVAEPRHIRLAIESCSEDDSPPLPSEESMRIGWRVGRPLIRPLMNAVPSLLLQPAF